MQKVISIVMQWLKLIGSSVIKDKNPFFFILYLYKICFFYIAPFLLLLLPTVYRGGKGAILTIVISNNLGHLS